MVNIQIAIKTVNEKNGKATRIGRLIPVNSSQVLLGFFLIDTHGLGYICIKVYKYII